MWENICHWSDSIFPFYEAVLQGDVPELSDVCLWQIPQKEFEESQYQRVTLNAALAEAKSAAANLHFDGGPLSMNRTVCLRRAVTVLEFNLLERSGFEQSALSHFEATARGFQKSAFIVLRCRNSATSSFQLSLRISG